MSETVLKQVWLGMKPFVLLEVDAESTTFDEDDEPIEIGLSMQFGGGMDQDAAYDFMEMLLEQRAAGNSGQ